MPRAGSILKKKSLRSLDSQLAPALLLTIIIHKIVEKFFEKKGIDLHKFLWGNHIHVCVQKL